MTRSTGPALLERPGTDHEPAADAVPAVAPVATGQAPAVETPDSDAVEDAPPARGRRQPRPPGRRGPMWLAALVAGAVVAALPSTLGSDTAGLSVSAADYGLGAASDVGFSGDMEEVGVRRGITEAEAQARLGELAASRAAREP